MADDTLDGVPGATESVATESVAAESVAAESVAAGSVADVPAGGETLLAEGNPARPAGTQEVPETYALTAPEGSTWNDEQMTAFHGHAKELGLTQAQAQKLLDVAHGNQREALEQHQQQVTRWAEDVRADRDMGGSRFAATVMQAKAGLKTFDPDGRVFGLLEETGYANHPEVIRFLSRIGKAHGEDTLVTGAGVGASVPLEDRLFKNM